MGILVRRYGWKVGRALIADPLWWIDDHWFPGAAEILESNMRGFRLYFFLDDLESGVAWIFKWSITYPVFLVACLVLTPLLTVGLIGVMLLTVFLELFFPQAKDGASNG